MLRTTRQQLAQAAEMGQALMVELQQLELLRQEYAQLEEQKEELEASVEENEWRIEELGEGQRACTSSCSRRISPCRIRPRR